MHTHRHACLTAHYQAREARVCAFCLTQSTLRTSRRNIMSQVPSGFRREADEWGSVFGRMNDGPTSQEEASTDLPTIAPHQHCSAAEALAWESVLSGTVPGTAQAGADEPGTNESPARAGAVAASAAALQAQHGQAQQPGGHGSAVSLDSSQPQPQQQQGSRRIPRLPAPRPLFALVECGSHTTRAVLHDGTQELVRQTAASGYGRGPDLCDCDLLPAAWASPMRVGA